MEKRIIIALQVIAIALVAYFGITMSQCKKAEENGITKFDLDSVAEVTATKGARFCFAHDKATYQTTGQKMINADGWCFIQGTSSVGANIQVLLKEKISNPNATAECYKLPTKTYIRREVTPYFHDGTNYDHCGFRASVEGKDFDFAHMQYEIWLLYSIGNTQYVINTGKVLEPAKE